MNTSTDWIQASCAVATFFLTIYLAWKNKDLQELIEVMKKQVSLLEKKLQILEKHRREEIMPKFLYAGVVKNQLILKNANAKGIAGKISIICSSQITPFELLDSSDSDYNPNSQSIRFFSSNSTIPEIYNFEFKFQDRDGNWYKQSVNKVEGGNPPQIFDPEPIDG